MLYNVYFRSEHYSCRDMLKVYTYRWLELSSCRLNSFLIQSWVSRNWFPTPEGSNSSQQADLNFLLTDMIHLLPFPILCHSDHVKALRTSLSRLWERWTIFTGPKNYFILCPLWNFKYFYWTDTFFTSHRNIIFRIDCTR